MSAASRARSASVAATTRSRWRVARVARRARGRTVNRPATNTARSQPSNGQKYGARSDPQREQRASRRRRRARSSGAGHPRPTVPPARRRSRSSGPAAASPGSSGIDPINAQRSSPGVSEMSRQELPRTSTVAAVASTAMPTATSRRSSRSGISRARPIANGSIPRMATIPATAWAGYVPIDAIGRTGAGRRSRRRAGSRGRARRRRTGPSGATRPRRAGSRCRAGWRAGSRRSPRRPGSSSPGSASCPGSRARGPRARSAARIVDREPIGGDLGDGRRLEIAARHGGRSAGSAGIVRSVRVLLAEDRLRQLDELRAVDLDRDHARAECRPRRPGCWARSSRRPGARRGPPNGFRRCRSSSATQGPGSTPRRRRRSPAG